MWRDHPDYANEVDDLINPQPQGDPMETARQQLNEAFGDFEARLQTNEDFDTIIQDLCEYLNSPEVAEIAHVWGTVTIVEELMQHEACTLNVLCEYMKH